MPPKASKTSKEPGASQPLIGPALAASSSASPVTSSPDESALVSRVVLQVLTELRAIFKEELRAMRDEMIKDLSVLRTDFSTLKSTVCEMEQSLSVYADETVTLRAKTEALEKQVEALSAKADDLESRSRRQNLRIQGVPEEFSVTPASVSELLKEALGLENLPELDRAHRTLAPKRAGVTRAIIVRFHRYFDCVDVLRRAKQKGWMEVRGMKLAVFQDFTAKVAKQRAAFNEVRSLLRERGVRFALLFPARLRVTVDGKDTVFTSAAEAREFVSKIH